MRVPSLCQIIFVRGNDIREKSGEKTYITIVFPLKLRSLSGSFLMT
jgi:hypothetical protein